MIRPTTQENSGFKRENLKELMYVDVVEWLNEKVVNFLCDYLSIKRAFESYGVGNLSDYSYLMTPSFKALEGTLIQLGDSLGFDLEQYNHKIGVVFSEDNLEKYYKDVLDKIVAISVEKKDDIKQWLNDARRILRHLRHSPAHFNGELKENWNKAFHAGDHVLFIINEMCHSMIASGLLQEKKSP